MLERKKAKISESQTHGFFLWDIEELMFLKKQSAHFFKWILSLIDIEQVGKKWAGIGNCTIVNVFLSILK